MKKLRSYIDSQWIDVEETETLDLINPATEIVIARIPAGCSSTVDHAVASAKNAQVDWGRMPLETRLLYLESLATTLEKNRTELAELEHQEMGKPIEVAEAFIDTGIAVLRGHVAQARDYKFVEELADEGAGQTIVIRHPLGVTALIVPWNFTITSILLGLGPLLASGNTVVLKPSEKASLSAVRMIELIDLPPGVLNMVLGDARSGAPLAAHPDVSLVHFTGSVESGRAVGVASAQNLHRSVLELGGKDPVLIDSDADPQSTATAVAFGSFANTGQICTSMERIYVHRDVAEDFIAALVSEAEKYTTGGGSGNSAIKMGPLVDDHQRAIVHEHVQDAVERGATVLTGGSIPSGIGFYYPATVLVDVTSDMRIMNEETFGPVAPIHVVDSFAEALELASDTNFGLTATVYSHNLENISRSYNLPAGIVWINQWQGGGLSRTYEPTRNSGLGATGGSSAFDAATRPATMIHALGSPMMPL